MPLFQRDPPVVKRATISPCGTYRYDLVRCWDTSKGVCLFVMLNPSTADAVEDDNTITRCVGFAGKWGYGTLAVVNLFAARATNPDELPLFKDPVGPDNDRTIIRYAKEADFVVAAWGIHGGYLRRDDRVKQILRRHCDVHALRFTKDRKPCHPLRQPGALVPQKWLFKRNFDGPV